MIKKKSVIMPIIESLTSRFTFIVLFIFLILSGCNDVEDLFTFHISDDTNITIESTSPLNLPFEIATPDITTNSSQEFENNNTRANLVKNIILQELTLEVIEPSDKTFSFLKSIHLYISTENQPEIELASLENIASTDNKIHLVPTKEKLDQYVKASAYTLRSEVITRETLTEDIEIKGSLKFKVTAKGL